jgi:hypothetical protein
VFAITAVPAVPVLEPPPHNGIGSEEDSKMNCYSLQPKPPTKDIKHFQQAAPPTALPSRLEC